MIQDFSNVLYKFQSLIGIIEDFDSSGVLLASVATVSIPDRDYRGFRQHLVPCS